ncbi:hypothetical protein LTR37_009779 [Vermiconidia calcicola]|uniref:Uncharacterized protein n=1 Tax=Vermiconidia calcicola TaxID=1690605 RepID=A0ACC3N722_9PEZI|nr:hypothetical protein LTR37_009779 [Vermiconidia calcicola]
MYGGMNGAVLPSPGYHSDMQILMENMERLSGTLQRNRQEWLSVQDGLARVERLQGRLTRDGQLPLTNGDAQSHDNHDPTTAAPPADESPTTLHLQTALAAANDQIASLKDTFVHQQAVQEDYRSALEDSKILIRNYWTEEQKYISELHTYYKTELDAARRETIEAQLVHQAWQARLKGLGEGVTKAFKAREEEGEPWKRKIAALKEENRILRRCVGWDPAPVDEEDEVEEEEELNVGPGRGRGSRGSQGGAEAVGAGGGQQEQQQQQQGQPGSRFLSRFLSGASGLREDSRE